MRTIKSVEYRLKGTRRRVNAIGKPEKFTVTVSRQQGTMSARGAMDTARKSMYDNGYEMILFTFCAIRKGRAWTEIPMLEALGLE